ncbi:hypothetical protein VOLCADRAFT_99655 [Volvox carteri f. nagariensis]|uniref:Uncharacterized protein n=1 Tax=Volvox carteri f. nagariensis TaxID=3068 RepID=D8UIA4_VOLCA|nr:uncharacterized protein VOLCADRAFT_99655 [Volvox carteri f. nagariensis]EFJ40554.1 hypothetical protein VOLCADRAFT_99655 [Volvox carteri f. nagariensis]|eukprot:XP_002958404.1 hypothetical protein VOLCADRAFT_99655 [Volvox carteri f. nagariensis]
MAGGWWFSVWQVYFGNQRPKLFWGGIQEIRVQHVEKLLNFHDESMLERTCVQVSSQSVPLCQADVLAAAGRVDLRGLYERLANIVDLRGRRRLSQSTDRLVRELVTLSHAALGACTALTKLMVGDTGFRGGSDRELDSYIRREVDNLVSLLDQATQRYEATPLMMMAVLVEGGFAGIIAAMLQLSVPAAAVSRRMAAVVVVVSEACRKGGTDVGCGGASFTFIRMHLGGPGAEGAAEGSRVGIADHTQKAARAGGGAATAAAAIAVRHVPLAAFARKRSIIGQFVSVLGCLTALLPSCRAVLEAGDTSVRGGAAKSYQSYQSCQEYLRGFAESLGSGGGEVLERQRKMATRVVETQHLLLVCRGETAANSNGDNVTTRERRGSLYDGVYGVDDGMYGSEPASAATPVYSAAYHAGSGGFTAPAPVPPSADNLYGISAGGVSSAAPIGDGVSQAVQDGVAAFRQQRELQRLMQASAGAASYGRSGLAHQSQPEGLTSPHNPFVTSTMSYPWQTQTSDQQHQQQKPRLVSYPYDNMTSAAGSAVSGTSADAAASVRSQRVYSVPTTPQRPSSTSPAATAAAATAEAAASQVYNGPQPRLQAWTETSPWQQQPSPQGPGPGRQLLHQYQQTSARAGDMRPPSEPRRYMEPVAASAATSRFGPHEMDGSAAAAATYGSTTTASTWAVATTSATAPWNVAAASAAAAVGVGGVGVGGGLRVATAWSAVPGEVVRSQLLQPPQQMLVMTHTGTPTDVRHTPLMYHVALSPQDRVGIAAAAAATAAVTPGPKSATKTAAATHGSAASPASKQHLQLRSRSPGGSSSGDSRSSSVERSRSRSYSRHHGHDDRGGAGAGAGGGGGGSGSTLRSLAAESGLIPGLSSSQWYGSGGATAAGTSLAGRTATVPVTGSGNTAHQRGTGPGAAATATKAAGTAAAATSSPRELPRHSSSSSSTSGVAAALRPPGSPYRSPNDYPAAQAVSYRIPLTSPSPPASSQAYPSSPSSALKSLRRSGGGAAAAAAGAEVLRPAAAAATAAAAAGDSGSPAAMGTLHGRRRMSPHSRNVESSSSSSSSGAVVYEDDDEELQLEHLVGRYVRKLEALQDVGGVPQGGGDEGAGGGRSRSRAATPERGGRSDSGGGGGGGGGGGRSVDQVALRGGKRLLRLLRTAWFKAPDAPEPSDVTSLERLFNSSAASSEVIRFARSLTVYELVSDEAFYAPFIPGCGMDYSGMSLQWICSHHVLPMGVEVEQLQIIALCRALGITLGVLDVAGSQVGAIKHGPTGHLGPPVAWVAHLPGHYDVVYPAKQLDVAPGGALVPVLLPEGF